MRTLSLLAICFLLLFPAAIMAGSGDHLVQASLLADVSSIQPSQTFNVGVLLKIDPGWHIYWMNPGDSGLATKVKVGLPDGFTAGAIQYPVPKKLQLPGDIINYSYDEQTMLLVPVTAPANLPIGKLIEITAKVNWLVCKDMCTPGTATLSLKLFCSNDAAPANAQLFQHWKVQLPLKHDPAHVADISQSVDLKATDSSRVAGNATITVQWKAIPSDIQWFPESISGVNLSEIKVSTERNMTIISFHVDASATDGHVPQIESVLAYAIPGGERIGLGINNPEK